MGRLKQRAVQCAVLLSTALALTSFPLQKPLAEGSRKTAPIEEKAENSKNAASKEGYRLVVSTENCKSTAGMTECLVGIPIPLGVVFTDIHNKSRNLSGQRINVTEPDGIISHINSEYKPVNFVPTKVGQYSFEYYDTTFVVLVRPKEDQGFLKLSTNSCSVGETIWVDVINCNGKQVKGETVKVFSSSGKESTVYISNELNGFVPDIFGDYNFVYEGQNQVVYVKHPSGIDIVEEISLVEFKHLMKKTNVGSDINHIEFRGGAPGLFAVYVNCEVGCTEFLFSVWKRIRGKDAEIYGQYADFQYTAIREPVLYIQNMDKFTVVGLGKFFNSIKETEDSKRLVARQNYDKSGKLSSVSFLIASSCDGAIGTISTFVLSSNSVSTGYLFINGASVYPLKDPKATPDFIETKKEEGQLEKPRATSTTSFSEGMFEQELIILNEFVKLGDKRATVVYQAVNLTLEEAKTEKGQELIKSAIGFSADFDFIPNIQLKLQELDQAPKP